MTRLVRGELTGRKWKPPKGYVLGTVAITRYGDGQLGGRPAREGHEEDAAWIRPVDKKMRDTMRESISFARARSGNDQQRWWQIVFRDPEDYSRTLIVVQLLEICRVHAAAKPANDALSCHGSLSGTKREQVKLLVGCFSE